MKSTKSTFALKISLNVLEHLGINLYSNVPSVLSEIVANAWDADAQEVRITWHRADNSKDDSITIEDTGLGMTPDDVNRRFLTVGYRRRDEQPGVTSRGRHPMGRKGIGKLSLFSIAGCIEIETAKDGQKSAFRMRLDDIRRRIEESGGEGTYRPEDMESKGIRFSHGTKITLTDLRKRQTLRTTQALKRRLSRRFSIIGASQGFRVFVDGEEVTASDRDYYDKIQYLWTYGDQSEIENLCPNAEFFDRTPSMEENDPHVLGWLATVKEVRNLKDEDGENLNRIAIFVRGKMAQEDILTDFSEGGVYANYLIGELRFDDLDIYEGPGTGTDKDEDAATSSRQSLVQDDVRYQSLKRFVGRELKHIQNEWQKLRAEEGADKALEIPAVKEWMDSLTKPTRDKARKWLGKINRIQLDELSEQKQLIKHAVLAFEFYEAKQNLDALERIDDNNLEAVLEIFSDIDGLEESLYGQIVRGRIEIIKTLEEKVDANERERAIQKFLFDHLWLLDPGWERAEGTEVLETRVKKLFKDIDAELTEDEKRGRLDIACRKSAGQHVIIELKRPERKVSTPELLSQISKYSSGMQSLLDAAKTPHELLQIVILLGYEPTDWTSTKTRQQSEDALKPYGARVVFYETLLRDARQTYQDYIKNKKRVDNLHKIIEAIDNYAPPAAS